MKNTHLNYFGVKNFKSFKGEHWFHLKNITFLIGQNSSGKSSLINALRLSYPNADKSDVSDIGLNSNWLNDQSIGEQVQFSNVTNTNIDYLNNRFYYFNTYYPEKINTNLYGEVFLKYYGEITESMYDSRTEEEVQYIKAFHPAENFYRDRYSDKYITEKGFNDYFTKTTNLINQRNESVIKLINYKIKSGSERQLWLDEKERLINEYNSPKPSWGEEWASTEQCVNPTPYALFYFIIDFVVENYDCEIENENYKHDAFYKGLTILTDSKKEKYAFSAPINYNFLNSLQLKPLKELLDNILKFDFVTPDLFKKYYFFFYKRTTEQISYSVEKKINLVYLSNKKNDLDYFLSKIKPEDLESRSFNERLEFVNKYLKIFNIGEQLHFEPIEVRGKVEIEPYIVKNGSHKKLFTHFGFGVQLLIPLLLEVLFNESEILLIEEPESNLHPALQSKLADFFTEISMVYNKQLVIETHSEYIIRRMQYLVANNYKKNTSQLPTLETDDVNIYYFNDPIVQVTNEQPYSYEIKFNENGLLDKDFGPGFIDEASNLTIDLLRISNFN